MKRIAFLILIFLIAIKGSFAQEGPKTNDIRRQVLRLNRVGKTYKFHTEDSTLTYLRFLGTINTAKGKNYKILTSVWILGLSHRATNRILVYTDKNKYLGNYYLTTSYDVPDYIQNNKLVFINKKESDCDPETATYLSFDNGIPKEFFRKCTKDTKGDSGDIYTFSAE